MSIVPSIQVLTDGRLTLHNEHKIPHPSWKVYVDVYNYVQNLDGLVTYLTKSLFLCAYLTKSNGVFGKMQIISYSFKILKHIYINLQFWKLLMLKSDCNFFGGTIRLDTRKPSHNKVILPVPALYISVFFYPDIARLSSWSQGPHYNEVPLYIVQWRLRWDYHNTKLEVQNIQYIKFVIYMK